MTFTPNDSADYAQAIASVTLLVNPAVLTVTADSISAPFGTTPVLAATISGFVNGDNASVVSGAPALATTANSSSLPAAYPINIGTGTLSAVNYTFNLIGGTYTVTYSAAAPSAGTLCNGACNGIFSGNITVSAGQVCAFVNGEVKGNLQVSGGNLQLVQTRIDNNVQISGGVFSLTSGTIVAGNLQIQNLPVSSASNQVCGATIKGDLTFQNNGAAVLIGATGATACAGNAVQGNMTIQSNTAPVSAVGNTVANNLTVQSNSAGTIVNGNTVGGNLVDRNNTGATQVFNDGIVGNLQCQGNTIITGGGDTAGSKQGQCAVF